MRRSPFCFHYTGFFRFFNPFLDKHQKTCYYFRRYCKILFNGTFIPFESFPL